MRQSVFLYSDNVKKMSELWSNCSFNPVTAKIKPSYVPERCHASKIRTHCTFSCCYMKTNFHSNLRITLCYGLSNFSYLLVGL